MEKKNAVYTITEDQSPEEARREHVMLVVRNLAAGAAAVLFLASFALADIHKLLRAAAYFLGAGAYFAEILVLTDGFRRKVPQKELFMAYCFGPLYILLGLSYLLEACPHSRQNPSDPAYRRASSLKCESFFLV